MKDRERQWQARYWGRSARIGILCALIVQGAWPVCALTTLSPGFAFRTEHGDTVRVSLAGSLFGQYGDMTYIIQGTESGGWKSELRWPLQRTLYGGGVLAVSIVERFHFSAGGWTNLTTRPGVMKDRDWFDELRGLLLMLYGDDTAIYGEFDTTLDALKFDGNMQVDVWRQSSVAVGVLAGYAYTRFVWVTGNGYQNSPISAYDVGAVTGAGIRYEQRLRTPYLGLAVSFAPHAVAATKLYALYSPIARCDDVDDHIMRKKESYGTTRGAFFSVGGDLSLRLASSWDFIAMVNHARYALDGFQDQVFYGGTNAGIRYSGIDMTVTGRQFALGASLRYNF